MKEIFTPKKKSIQSIKTIENDVFRDESLLNYKNIDIKSYIDSENYTGNENVLGVVDFNRGNVNKRHLFPNQDIPYLNVHIPPFNGDSCIEVWTSNNKVSYGKVGNIQFAVDGENMFASASLPQREGITLAKFGEEIYDELFRLAVNLHYPYFYRMWNFVPAINKNDINEMERYKSFCYGRATSFFKNAMISENIQFPAATGIGSISGNICIYFLSSLLSRYKHFENPRQVPAYSYPEQYGLKPPSFARATYYNRGNEKFHIYVSGTASVVGHQSMHIGDIEKQCITIFENIDILLSQENLNRYGIDKKVTLKELDEIKVYIRHSEHYEQVRELCTYYFNTEHAINYLLADVCRSDLLVEIEGVIKKFI